MYIKLRLFDPNLKPNPMNTALHTITVAQKQPKETIIESCRKHHKSLFFCSNIRTGIDRMIDIDRILAYVAWYGETIFFPQLELEEETLFSLIDEEHYLIIRANKEHRRLRRLFTIGKNPMKNLICLEEELEFHIRFEEKNLYPEFEKKSTQKQLKLIKKQFNKLPSNSDWNDPFWL